VVADGSAYSPWRASSNTALVSPLQVDDSRPASLGIEPFTSSAVMGSNEVAAVSIEVAELPAFQEH
jgi:hypothetical protein